MLASSGSDEVKLWDPWHWEENPRRLPDFTGVSPPNKPGSFTFMPDGTLQQSICNQNASTVTLRNSSTRREISVYRAPNPNAAAFSPDGKTLAIGILEDGKGKVAILDATSHLQRGLLTADTRLDVHHEVGALAFSSDGKSMAAASGDPALVTVWDLASEKQIGRFQHGNAAAGI